MGGEKQAASSSCLSGMGSPPRGRGKDRLVRNGASPQGITPAWAGKSYGAAPLKCPGGDHPRVGGEKNAYYELGQTKPGSPPRGRGKDILTTFDAGKLGITPAWAGKRFPALG